MNGFYVFYNELKEKHLHIYLQIGVSSSTALPGIQSLNIHHTVRKPRMYKMQSANDNEDKASKTSMKTFRKGPDTCQNRLL